MANRHYGTIVGFVMDLQAQAPVGRRSAYRKAFDFFASWKLSVVITLSGALYAVFLSIWGARSPAHVVQTIASMWPMSFFYWLLLINTLCCILRRFKALIRGTSRLPIHVPHNADWHRVVDRLPRYQGSATSNDGGYFWLYRRYATIGTLVLHLSLFVVAAGFLLSHSSHIEGTLRIGQHQHIQVDASTFEKISPPGRDRQSLPTPAITVDDIAVEFWEDELLFTSFTANLVISGRSQKIAINRPLILSMFNHIRLTSFGYAPMYMVIKNGMSVPLEEGASKLNIFPPGNADLLRLQNFPHRIYLRFYPDWQQGEFGSSSRSMRLENPRFDVDVFRGKIPVASKTVQLGESLPIEAFDFSILGVVPTAELTIIRDHGLPFIILGFAIAIVGLILRSPGKRAEILAIENSDGGWQIWGKNIEETQ